MHRGGKGRGGKKKKLPGSIEHGWDKSGNKSLIVRRIFIRTLEMIYCAKIGRVYVRYGDCGGGKG